MSAICNETAARLPSQGEAHQCYAVGPTVWVRARSPDGFLCVGCFERRLGRRLAPEDFPGAPVNAPHPWDTAHLVSRKAGLPECALVGSWPR